MIDVVTIGWLTMDDIVLTDHRCRPNVMGGGALYSAVGAQIWTANVGVHSVTGQRFLDQVRQGIEGRGMDAQGVRGIVGNGLQLWLLHESATDKQQVPKLSSSSAEEMDRARGPLSELYAAARGFHIAPQTPAGSIENARRLRGLHGNHAVTLDLLSDEFIDRRAYADLDFLDSVTAFLPSEAEVMRIWNPSDLPSWLRRQALAHHCHIGVKLGEQGSLICSGQTGDIHQAPAFRARTVDTTGAGDAYCGGFLAGLVAGRPLVECAAMATVSASYVVEACGALETERPQPLARDARLATVLNGVSMLR